MSSGESPTSDGDDSDCSSAASSACLSSSSSSVADEFDEEERRHTEEHVARRKSPPRQPTPSEPTDATPAADNARSEYDMRFEETCRRLPSAMRMRPVFVPYTPEVGYLDMQDQVTDVRGCLEPAAVLFAEQQRAAQELHNELFADVDRILQEEGLLQELEQQVGATPLPTPQPTIPIAAYAPTTHIPPNATQPLPAPQLLPGATTMPEGDAMDPMNMAAMLGDVMQQQVTFNTAPLPKHVERERITLQRYAADGIRDVRAAIDNCVVCSYMSSTDNSGTRILDECMQKFKAICRWVVTRPMHITCVAASKYWNNEFVRPCLQYGATAPPKITPSHVELCLLNCNHNLKGLLILRREIAMLEDTLEVLQRNQLYVRQEVAGVPTNKYQVTQSGYKIMHDLMNQLMNCRKLEWGAMTVIERDTHEAPLSANPLHDSAMRPRKRSELTREREALHAASKRNNKNFRGSSGMGGNTGVGVLQVGGYGGGVTGGFSSMSTAREHQTNQRNQLFRGGLM